MSSPRQSARALLTSRGLLRRAAIIAGLAAVGVGVLAQPAWAHHPILSGQTGCGDGNHIVTWSIQNSETTPSHVMTIATADAVANGVHYAVTGYSSPVPAAGTTTATTSIPGGVTGTVTLTVFATWPDGASATRATSVELVGDCGSTSTTTSTSTTSTTTSTSTTSTTSSTTTSTTTEPSTTSTTAATTSTTAAAVTTTTDELNNEGSTLPPLVTTTTLESSLGSTMPNTSTTQASSTRGGVTPTTTAPGGALPFTGNDGLTPLLGLAALGFGGALWLIARRRHATRGA